MKRYVEVEPVCPFLGGKPCIKDGWQWNANVFHPCAFFDETASMNDNEPCLIKQTVNKIIGDDRDDNSVPLDLPWIEDSKE